VTIFLAPSPDLLQTALQAFLHRLYARSIGPSPASLRNVSQAEEIERVRRLSHPFGLFQGRPSEFDQTSLLWMQCEPLVRKPLVEHL